MSSPLFIDDELDGIEVLRCGPLHAAGVPHAFSFRTGSFGRREDGERLSRALGFSRHSLMRQVHGNEVLSFDGGTEAPICDGLVTDRRGVGLIVQTADCVPLLFWASDRNTVAAVHAGWRGTLARIGACAVQKLDASPQELHVAIGPAIRVCCYEVGDEVIERFADPVSRPGPRGRRHLDLIEINRRELLDSGVREERIYDSGRCTSCENDRFHSFRKEGPGVGRIFGAIGLA